MAIHRDLKDVRTGDVNAILARFIPGIRKYGQ
jgi:hypothetical protein